MIEMIVEFFQDWLTNGSDKGTLGKVRRWLRNIVIALFIGLMIAAYVINLPTMNTALAIGLPFLAVLVGVVFLRLHIATNSGRHDGSS